MKVSPEAPIPANITIAVIEKNRCTFDDLGKYASPLLYTEHSADERRKIKNQIDDYIWSVIGPYIKFIEIDGSDLLSQVCENLIKYHPGKSYDDFFYHTEGSYSFPKKYIEFIHAQPLWHDYCDGQAENINNVGCLMSLKQHVIENTCIVFGNDYVLPDIKSSQTTVIGSINKKDIIRIIKRRFYFSAILIKESSIVKYYYQNPVYLISKIYGLAENDTIEKLSCDLFKYNLLLYFQHNKINRKDKYVNKIATRINGLYQLHGDVLMLHELEENIFANISLREAKRLNVLSYGRLYDRQSKPEEVHTVVQVDVDEKGSEHEKKVTPFWSRYIIMNKRMDKWKKEKNKCINCHGEIKNLIVCDKCYRAKYCSESCQKEFSSYHTEECINPKSLV